MPVHPGHQRPRRAAQFGVQGQPKRSTLIHLGPKMTQNGVQMEGGGARARCGAGKRPEIVVGGSGKTCVRPEDSRSHFPLPEDSFSPPPLSTTRRHRFSIHCTRVARANRSVPAPNGTLGGILIV